MHPPYGPLHDYYSANSVGLLVNGQPAAYTNANVFTADTSGGKAPNYANIYSTMRTDTAGNYYAVFNGTADDNHVLSPGDHPRYWLQEVLPNGKRVLHGPVAVR